MVEAARAAVVWVMAERGELVMAGGREVVAKGEVVMAAEMAAVETAAETVRLRVAAREGVEMVVAKVCQAEGMEVAEMVGGMAMLEEAREEGARVVAREVRHQLVEAKVEVETEAEMVGARLHQPQRPEVVRAAVETVAAVVR